MTLLIKKHPLRVYWHDLFGPIPEGFAVNHCIDPWPEGWHNQLFKWSGYNVFPYDDPRHVEHCVYEKWCEENCEDFFSYCMNYGYIFKSRADAIKFKMRWEPSSARRTV